jgi:integral membrane protein (TIGR01906 family)
MPSGLVRLLKWLVVLAMPIFLVLTVTRLMFTGWFPRWEYARPGFPSDPFGFTAEQRMEYAVASIGFLNSPQPPEQAVTILAALRLPDSNQPLFAPNELSHMVDVKRLTDRIWSVWLISVVIVVIGSIVLLARRATRRLAYLAFRDGGALTAGLLAALFVFILLSWRSFFILFHDIFFPPGTWTFEWENSLIRIFPDKFWFDAFSLPLAAVFLFSLMLWVLGRFLARRAPQEVVTGPMTAAARKG